MLVSTDQMVSRVSQTKTLYGTQNTLNATSVESTWTKISMNIINWFFTMAISCFLKLLSSLINLSFHRDIRCGWYNWTHVIPNLIFVAYCSILSLQEQPRACFHCFDLCLIPKRTGFWTNNCHFLHDNVEFIRKFHWSLFLRVHFTVSRTWFR